MNHRGELFIDGAWRRGHGGPIASQDPANDAPIWSGRAAAEGDVRDALAAARQAFRSWARSSLADRRQIVFNYRDLVTQHQQPLAELIARETGKPRWEAEAEVRAMAAKVDISLRAHEARAGYEETRTGFGRTALRHRPHGVMVVLGPYNFPGHLPNGHIVPALIAGNAVVFKPSELTPAVGEAMVALWAEAGIPPGVVNLVQGGGSVGAALLDPDAIDGVLFTGSARTGAAIHRSFGGRTDVILALEMGGNNPLVVWDVANVEAAASLVVQSAFVTTGQRCSCARRLIVPEGPRGDRIVTATAELASAARIGAWNDEPPPFMGPLISRAAVARVLEAQQQLVSTGAIPRLTSVRIDGRASTFVSPAVLDLGGARAPDEEIFGPLLTVARARDFAHAIRIANSTRYGLAAGLVADDAELWDEFVATIRAGVVNWNRPTTGAASTLPFGGPGLSGNHRPGAWYAADYCAYPMASQEADALSMVDAPGLGPGRGST